MTDQEPKFDKSVLDGLDEEIAAARQGEPAKHVDVRSALDGLDEEVAAARRGEDSVPNPTSVLDGLEEEIARERQERGLPPANPPQRQ